MLHRARSLDKGSKTFGFDLTVQTNAGIRLPSEMIALGQSTSSNTQHDLNFTYSGPIDVVVMLNVTLTSRTLGQSTSSNAQRDLDFKYSGVERRAQGSEALGFRLWASSLGFKSWGLGFMALSLKALRA